MRYAKLAVVIVTTVAVLTAPALGSGATLQPSAPGNGPGSGPGDGPTRGGNATFDIAGLNAPSVVEGGENITVSATVTNTGNTSARVRAEYRLDGRRRGVETVRLGAGNSTTVSFQVSTGGLTTGNHTHGVYVSGDNATATLTVENGTVPARGPIGGMPPGVNAFTNTTPLRNSQVDPASLAGKIRVDREHAANTTVELTKRSGGNTTFNVTVTGHARNVTFFFQTAAIAASQNVSDVTAMVDGDPIAFGLTNASNSSWVGIEIDHFSSRTVTFSRNRSTVPTGPTLPGAANPAADIDGDAQLEDVDGNGQAGIADVLSYYNNRKSSAVRDNTTQFDFDGDGVSGTIGDALALFEDISTP